MAKKFETTVAEPPRSQDSADDLRVGELAREIFIQLVTSRTAEGRTAAHYAGQAFENAKAFFCTADTLTPE